MKLVAIVLAAGASRRLGSPKQLVVVDGAPIVTRVTEALSSSCVEIGLVVGAVRDVPCANATILTNDDWKEGMASSIRLGVRWAESVGADGVLVASCDQYRLSRAHVDALAHAFQEGHRTIASRYDDVLGVPAIFARERFGALASLKGDRGARTILRRACDVYAIDWPDGSIDLDTPEDALSAASAEPRRC